MSPKTANTKPIVEDEDADITVDMTTAKTLEPLPVDKPYLMAISKFQTGKSGSGGKKVDYELTVAEPAVLAGRKVIGSTSLENEYTLGMLMNLLIAAGMPEDEVKVKNFSIPKEDDVLGMQLTVWVNIRKSEQYGDRNGIRRMRPASAYKEATSI